MKKNFYILYWIFSFFLMCFIFNHPITALAESEKDISLEQVTEDEHTAIINIETNGLKVRLPNGNWVSSNQQYFVNRNGTYAFAYLTENDTIETETIRVRGLRENYLITASKDVDLELTSSDALSGISDMRLKNEDNGTWSSFREFATKVSWVLDNAEGLKTVYAQFRDKAGNISESVFDKIILDLTAPEGTVIINDGEAYTKSNVVRLTLSATDNYTSPKYMYVGHDGMNYTKVPYTTSYTYTFPTESKGQTIYIKFEDEVGNISSHYTDDIYVDLVNPFGTVTIQNTNGIAPTPNAKIDLTFGDAHSGIAEVKIVEGDKEQIISPIASPKTIDWTLESGVTGKVSMIVTDKAGNIFVVESNEVIIGVELEITNFKMTNWVTIENSSAPLTWEFESQPMFINTDVSIAMDYQMNEYAPQNVKVTSQYTVTITDNAGYSYENTFDFASHNKDGNKGTFEGTFKIPADAPKGAKVYIHASTTATIDDTVVGNDTFIDENSKAEIGYILGDIQKYIQFNEIR